MDRISFSPFAGALVVAFGSLAPAAASAQAEDQPQLALVPEEQPALSELDAEAPAEAPPPRIVIGPEGVAGGAMRYPVRSELAGRGVQVSFSANPRAEAVAALEGGALPTHAPVSGRVTSNFGSRVHPVHGTIRRHAGVDLAAPAGSPVRATSDGVVSAAGWAGNYGLRVALDHGGAVETRYAHLSQLNVRAGQQVRRGEVIGFVGSTGLSTGPHVHYELRRGGQAIDPLAR